MIKNIPNAYTQEELILRLDEVIMGMYDFIYLPIDFVVLQKVVELTVRTCAIWAMRSST